MCYCITFHTSLVSFELLLRLHYLGQSTHMSRPCWTVTIIIDNMPVAKVIILFLLSIIALHTQSFVYEIGLSSASYIQSLLGDKLDFIVPFHFIFISYLINSIQLQFQFNLLTLHTFGRLTLKLTLSFLFSTLTPFSPSTAFLADSTLSKETKPKQFTKFCCLIQHCTFYVSHGVHIYKHQTHHILGWGHFHP